MSTTVRFLRLLSLVLWIGGIAFFAFVLAPVAFGRLPSAREAGLVVGGALRVLHSLGLVCGAVFLLATLLECQRGRWERRIVTECCVVLAMVVVTACSQYVVLPRMEGYRTEAGGDVDAARATSPARLGFERLHKLSEQLEGAVLFGGLTVLLLLASEGPVARTVES